MTIDDVGNVAAFLLSDLAAGVTSEIVYVDGGFSHAMAGTRRPNGTAGSPEPAASVLARTQST